MSRLECILKLLVVSLGLLCLLSVPGAEAAAPACPTYEALTALAARPALVRLAIKGNCPAPAQLTARVTRASGEAEEVLTDFLRGDDARRRRASSLPYYVFAPEISHAAAPAPSD